MDRFETLDREGANPGNRFQLRSYGRRDPFCQLSMTKTLLGQPFYTVLVFGVVGLVGLDWR